MSETTNLSQFNQRYEKKDVSEHEASMYRRVQQILTCVPRFISYDPITQVMITLLQQFRQI